MTKISDEQKKFLNEHNISLGAVFDAAGMGPKQYGTIMKELGKKVAIGVTACKKGGHTLRSRSAHCIECNTANITFQQRYEDEAFVYVAGSIRKEIIKVGQTSNILKRENSLNRLGYGGIEDWKIVYWARVPMSGRVEFNVQNKLSNFSAPTSYYRSGIEVSCLETFHCNIIEAIKEIKKTSIEIYDDWFDETIAENYQFKKKIGEKFSRSGNQMTGSRAAPIFLSPKILDPLLLPGAKKKILMILILKKINFQNTKH